MNYVGLNHQHFPEIETVSIGNDKAVIVIRVSGKMGTYCYDGRPYIRHGPTTQIMPRSEYEKRVLVNSMPIDDGKMSLLLIG